MSTPMMGCGHAANALRGDRPVCVSCYGIVVGADTVVDTPPLEGREAVCRECDATKPSSLDLPFFEHRPGQDRDSFYSGCRGWG